MPINTRESYIEIGTGYDASTYELYDTLRLPVPNELPSGNTFLYEKYESAIGSLMIEERGRTQYTTQIRWSRLKNTDWWKINRWFDNHKYVFYMKYFNHTDGKVKIHKFVRDEKVTALPSKSIEYKGGYAVPTHYLDCGFSIIDMGESDVITVSEVY